ncbi:MAG: phosphotransferase, partial [Planctomycetales bacterium]
NRNLAWIPVPVKTIRGAGFVEHGDRFWELTPWLPGKADFHAAPNSERLREALRTLARFHEATRDFQHDLPAVTPAPGIQQRIDRLESLRDGGLGRIRKALQHSRSSDPMSEPMSDPIAEPAGRLLELFPRAAEEVRRTLLACQLPVPMQPCIRDVWHDHILFSGNEVTGLVDFGAMRIETVAGDVARLLGSLVRDDPDGWKTGLAAYQETRPLSSEELSLVAAFDRSAILMSGFSWLTWIYEERREFENLHVARSRLEENIQRLTNLISRGPVI